MLFIGLQLSLQPLPRGERMGDSVTTITVVTESKCEVAHPISNNTMGYKKRASAWNRPPI